MVIYLIAEEYATPFVFWLLIGRRVISLLRAVLLFFLFCFGRLLCRELLCGFVVFLCVWHFVLFADILVVCRVSLLLYGSLSLYCTGLTLGSFSNCYYNNCLFVVTERLLLCILLY